MLMYPPSSCSSSGLKFASLASTTVTYIYHVVGAYSQLNDHVYAIYKIIARSSSEPPLPSEPCQRPLTHPHHAIAEVRSLGDHAQPQDIRHTESAVCARRVSARYWRRARDWRDSLCSLAVHQIKHRLCHRKLPPHRRRRPVRHVCNMPVQWAAHSFSLELIALITPSVLTAWCYR